MCVQTVISFIIYPEGKIIYLQLLNWNNVRHVHYPSPKQWKKIPVRQNSGEGRPGLLCPLNSIFVGVTFFGSYWYTLDNAWAIDHDNFSFLSDLE